MKYKIIVETFKPTGKWYASGEYETELLNMYEIFEEVKLKALEGIIPGLSLDAAWTTEPNRPDWILRVTSDEHPNGYPGLIILKRDANGARCI